MDVVHARPALAVAHALLPVRPHHQNQRDTQIPHPRPLISFRRYKLTQPIRRHERNTAVSAGGGVYTSGGGGAVGEGRGGGVEQHWVHLDK